LYRQLVLEKTPHSIELEQKVIRHQLLKPVDLRKTKFLPVYKKEDLKLLRTLPSGVKQYKLRQKKSKPTHDIS
tara:strand:+ start:420 stop:638 length:219 start_codon:yes stop_codon:yes gene_type:complete